MYCSLISFLSSLSFSPQFHYVCTTSIFSFLCQVIFRFIFLLLFSSLPPSLSLPLFFLFSLPFCFFFISVTYYFCIIIFFLCCIFLPSSFLSFFLSSLLSLSPSTLPFFFSCYYNQLCSSHPLHLKSGKVKTQVDLVPRQTTWKVIVVSNQSSWREAGTESSRGFCLLCTEHLGPSKI